MLFAYAVAARHFWEQVRNGYSDFISFYAAAKILQSGAGDMLYDLGLQYEIQRQYAPNVKIRAGALPYVRPSFEAWIFAPFASLSYQTAFLVWNSLSIALLIVVAITAKFQVPGLGKAPPILLVLSTLSYFPVFITVLQGQDSVLLFVIYFLAYMALRARKELWGGLIFGFGMLKFPLVVPFLVPFVVARRLRILAGFCITSLLLMVFSAFTTGLRSLSSYPAYLLSIDKLARGINDPRDMPNLRGIVSVILGSHVSSITLKVVIVTVSLCLLAWLATKNRFFVPSESRLFSLAFALDSIVTILVSYHAHVFDLVLLLLFLAIGSGVLLSSHELTSLSRQLLSTAVGLVLFSPLYFVLSLLSRYTTVLALILLGTCFVLARAILDLECSASKAQTVSLL